MAIRCQSNYRLLFCGLLWIRSDGRWNKSHHRPFVIRIKTHHTCGVLLKLVTFWMQVLGVFLSPSQFRIFPLNRMSQLAREFSLDKSYLRRALRVQKLFGFPVRAFSISKIQELKYEALQGNYVCLPFYGCEPFCPEVAVSLTIHKNRKQQKPSSANFDNDHAYSKMVTDQRLQAVYVKSSVRR